MTEHRGYRILPIRNLIGYELQHIGRGSIHSSLLGSFTSLKAAKDAIDTYLNGKEEMDGKTDSSGGSEQIQRRPYHRRKPVNDS